MLLIADNIHALNPVVSRAMEQEDPAPIRKLARELVAAGADMIDINPGYLPSRKLYRMEFLVQTVQQVTDRRLVLDSPNPLALAAGAKVCNETPILNAVWNNREKMDAIFPLAVELGSPVVVLLMDERSFSPPSVEEKIALCLEVAGEAEKFGLGLDRLIFDPVTPNMSWEDNATRMAANLQVIRMLSTGVVFDEPVATMAGLSNLRSGMASRISWKVEQAALYMALGAGLEMALADLTRDWFIESMDLIKGWRGTE